MTAPAEKAAYADRVEALADAWASIDGKLEKFRAGKTSRVVEDFYGHYQGYTIEAAEMIKRLEARGYTVVSLPETQP